jgi:hypothetical protein
MKAKATILCLFLLSTCSAFGQNKVFEDFFDLQDSLMHKAYEERDPVKYLVSFNKFEAEYSKLSDTDKKYFMGNRITALYNLSCTYSLVNDKKNGIAYLKKSIDAGYNDYGHIQKDSDLDNIRHESAYLEIMKVYRELYDYLYILKKGGAYNLREKQEIPGFTYQDAGSTELVRLRKTFGLDSIAGNGDDVSKVLNILHWVHNTVSHDGQHDSGIKEINAYEILTAARSRQIGVCCGELATVIKDCYLAMGWPARKVYCYPKDSLGTDNDSHVIDIVYLSSLHKWIWIDPTNDAWVMDEKGQLLSIEEVRYRLVNDKQVVVNPGANWNHKQIITKEYYLDNYMAKNLYMMECPINSVYDCETRSQGKTISYLILVPLDYHKKTLSKETRVDAETGTTIITYRTNNPVLFWKIPE